MSASMIQASFSLHEDAQTIADEWSGITDPIVRRKLQNRLNQRASRRRKTTEAGHNKTAKRNAQPQDSKSSLLASMVSVIDFKACSKSTIGKVRQGSDGRASDNQHTSSRSSSSTPYARTPATSDQSSLPRQPRAIQDTLATARRIVFADYTYTHDNASISSPVPSTSSFTLHGTAASALSSLVSSPHSNIHICADPTADTLLSLIYYNVYRALAINVAILGLRKDLMCEDHYQSPFMPLSTTATNAIHNLPPSLEPTFLQQTVSHHPIWDIFPDPIVRDNLLRVIQRIGEDVLDAIHFPSDLLGDGGPRIGICGAPPSSAVSASTAQAEITELLEDDVEEIPRRVDEAVEEEEGLDEVQQTTGLIVWNDPWDIWGWEVSERFARKWRRTLLKGARRLEVSTNMWRRKRGLGPLEFA